MKCVIWFALCIIQNQKAGHSCRPRRSRVSLANDTATGQSPLHTWPRNGIAQPHSWDVYCCAESGVLQQTPYPHWWGFRDFMSRLYHKTAAIRMRERKLCPKCVGCSSCLLLWFTYLYKCTRKNLFAQQWLHMLFPVSIDGIHKWISLCDTAAIGK